MNGLISLGFKISCECLVPCLLGAFWALRHLFERFRSLSTILKSCGPRWPFIRSSGWRLSFLLELAQLKAFPRCWKSCRFLRGVRVVDKVSLQGSFDIICRWIFIQVVILSQHDIKQGLELVHLMYMPP